MRVLVSGQARVAVFTDEAATSIMRLDRGEYRLTRDSSVRLEQLFGNAGDLEIRECDSLDEIRDCLGMAYVRDVSIRLALVLLNRSEILETRQKACDAFESRLADPMVESFISDRLHSRPLHREMDFARAIDIAGGSDARLAYKILRTVELRQPSIDFVSDALRVAMRREGVSDSAAAVMEDVFAGSGVFEKTVAGIYDENATAIPATTGSAAREWGVPEGTIAAVLAGWDQLVDVSDSTEYFLLWLSRRLPSYVDALGVGEFAIAMRHRLSQRPRADEATRLVQIQLDALTSGVRDEELVHVAALSDRGDFPTILTVLRNVWTARECLLRAAGKTCMPWVPLEIGALFGPDDPVGRTGVNGLKVEEGDPLPIRDSLQRHAFEKLEQVEYERSLGSIRGGQDPEWSDLFVSAAEAI